MGGFTFSAATLVPTSFLFWDTFPSGEFQSGTVRPEGVCGAPVGGGEVTCADTGWVSSDPALNQTMQHSRCGVPGRLRPSPAFLGVASSGPQLYASKAPVGSTLCGQAGVEVSPRSCRV